MKQEKLWYVRFNNPQTLMSEIREFNSKELAEQWINDNKQDHVKYDLIYLILPNNKTQKTYKISKTKE